MLPHKGRWRLCKARVLQAVLFATVCMVITLTGLHVTRDTTQRKEPLIRNTTKARKSVFAPSPRAISMKNCYPTKSVPYLAEAQKKIMSGPEKIVCSLKLRPRLMFCGSFEDLRHALVIGTKYLTAAADLYNKPYDFDFPPLTKDYLLVEEYVYDVGDRFMDDLVTISRNNRATYTSLAAPPRPLLLFIALRGVSNFYKRIEQPQHAALRAELINSTIIVVSQGVDDVPSTFFEGYQQLEQFLQAPYLRMWFTQNCDIHHPKVRPLPIGTNHHFTEATPTFNRQTLAVADTSPYLSIQESKMEFMLTWLRQEGRVLQNLNMGRASVSVENRWQDIEECDTEMLKGTERRTFSYSGGNLSPCLLKELGDQCEVVLLAANIRSMSAQDRCGVISRDRTHFEQIAGLADKPQLSVFVRKTAGAPPTVYLPLVDLYYIFMTSTLGHARRKMRIYASFRVSSNSERRAQVVNDLTETRLGDFGEAAGRLEYRRTLGEYAFTASPIGNGYDCHRTWEALLAGSIPIVSPPYLFTRQKTYNSSALADIFADLPIIMVDSYINITEAKLKKWASEVRAKAARGEYKFEKLFSYHYLNEIRKLL